MRFGEVSQVSKTVTRPSPIRGINAYDSIAEMPEGYALVLRNLYAQPYGCQVRHGYVRHAEVDGIVETVISHNTIIPKLYCVTDQGTNSIFYDVTTPDAVPVELQDALTNARWQHINFPNVAGVNLVMVNGEDDMMWVKPDGSLQLVTVGDGTANTISGIDPKKLTHIYSHQKRLWFVEKETTFGWYLPPNQIFGVAAEFDFGPNWTRGGYLMQIITWTIDDGDGADDHLVAISSEGEVSVYNGTDPEGIDTWGLQGVYYAGEPLGRRAAARFGGDVIILTANGIVLLSNLLQSTKVNPTESNNGKYIQQLVSLAATEKGNSFGWQPFMFPGANMAMVNVPIDNKTSFQFALNDITKAWSEFIGYQAMCWVLHQSLPVYGAFGAVYRAWEGYTDEAILTGPDETIGKPIKSEAQTVYSDFGRPVSNKHYKMVRPVIISNGDFSISIACKTDYQFSSAQSPVAFPILRPGNWDESYWDTALWAGGITAYAKWQTVNGIGYTAALRMLISSASETYWAASDWLYEEGGIF